MFEDEAAALSEGRGWLPGRIVSQARWKQHLEQFVGHVEVLALLHTAERDYELAKGL